LVPWNFFFMPKVFPRMGLWVEYPFFRKIQARKGLRHESNHQILGPWNPHTFFRGVQTYIIILMSGDFKTIPFVIVFWHFFKGFSKEIDHLSFINFFTFQNFSKKINHLSIPK
jgi:hypothetical protein